MRILVISDSHGRNDDIEGVLKQVGDIDMMIHCGDVFYRDRTNDAYRRLIEKYHCACGDMESFALFCNAAMTGKEAAVLITISDTAFSKEKLSPVTSSCCSSCGSSEAASEAPASALLIP